MRHLFAIALASVVALGMVGGPSVEEIDGNDWPRRVLLTNDNGIDDTAIVELARALAEVTEVHVVAATTDRSGTSNLMTAPRTGRFEVSRVDLGEGISAYALDGYPADCVIFALSGPLRETPPDLVISGINGGANLADAWFGSGTIGAARTAAYFGFPAVAISGVEDDDPVAVRNAVDWTVQLVKSEAVRALQAPQYLTISLPERPAVGVQGVEVTHRARGLISGAATLENRSAQGKESWRLELGQVGGAGLDTDVAAAGRDRIAVVAMRVDEHDPNLHAALTANPGWLPAWPEEHEMTTHGGQCRSGLGVLIDDAEDERGEEWGVLIEEVLPGGRAEEAGLLAGDVVVQMNGIQLAQPGPEDPEERLVRLLTSPECGQAIRLTINRSGQLIEIDFLPIADP